MKRASFGARWPDLRILVAAIGAALVAVPASGDPPPPDDGAPSGAVAFFMMTQNGLCPNGWKPATYATGRLVVGTTTADDVGVTVGKPLADQEDRAHAHTWNAMVTLPDQAIAAADGGNNQGAAAQTYAIMDTTDPSPSGLPFIQLLACEKQ